MDDLKLYGKDNDKLKCLLCIVKKVFWDGIGMEFGLSKCTNGYIQERETDKLEFSHVTC